MRTYAVIYAVYEVTQLLFTRLCGLGLARHSRVAHVQRLLQGCALCSGTAFLSQHLLGVHRIFFFLFTLQ